MKWCGWSWSCTGDLSNEEVPGMWKVCKGSCRWWAEPAQERGCVGCKQQGHGAELPKPLELTSCLCEPQMQDVDLSV
jgi:hypothetical protein